MLSADVAQNVNEIQSPGWAGAFWRHGVLTPDGRRLQDASRLTFSLQLVILIVGMSGGFWMATYSLRSDVRDILTRMGMQAEIDKTNARLQEERAANLRESIEAMKRRQELQQYEIQGLKEMVLKQGVRK